MVYGIRSWLISCGLALFAFAFYLHGAYPSVSVGDSGEFITTAQTLGVPHAPGFPSYILLARTVDGLIPWANHGYRLNLFSAFCGALTVAVVFGLLLQLRIGAPLAVIAALIFMSSSAQVVNAQATEVFALHALFSVGVLWAACAEQWILGAYLLGLGFGNHQTILLLGPALGVLYLFSQKKTHPAALVTAAAAGLSIYLVVYVRAGKHPFLDYGHPDTLERLWRDFTRADYGSMTLALGTTPERSLGNTGLQLWRFFKGQAHQITAVGVVLAMAGMGLWLRRDFKKAFPILLGFLCCGPFFFLLGNLPFDAQSVGLLERFHIVPLLIAIVLFAGGWETMVSRHRWLLAVLALVPVFLWVKQVAAFPFRQDYIAYGYGRNNLRTLKPQSVLFIDGGDDTFYSLAYLTQIEHRRPDVELHDRGGVVFESAYGSDFRQLSNEQKEKRRQDVEQSVLKTGRPLFYSTMNPQILEGVHQEQQGILYQAGSAGTPADPFWQIYDVRQIPPWGVVSAETLTDYRTRALIPYYAYQRGVEAARTKEWDEALRFSQAAKTLGPDVLWLQPNFVGNAEQWAYAAIQSSQWELARRWYTLLLSWEPSDATLWVNLGAVEERDYHLDVAMGDYQRAIALNPGQVNAHFNLAVGYWKMERWKQVVDELQTVLAIDPNNTAAQHYLPQALARLQGTAK